MGGRKFRIHTHEEHDTIVGVVMIDKHSED